MAPPGHRLRPPDHSPAGFGRGKEIGDIPWDKEAAREVADRWVRPLVGHACLELRGVRRHRVR